MEHQLVHKIDAPCAPSVNNVYVNIFIYFIFNIYFQIGPGGSIQALKFDPRDSQFVLTASIDGTVTKHGLDGKHRMILADTMNCHE